MRPYVAEVLGGSTWFDETIIYSKGQDSPGPRLRAARLDKVVLLTNSLRTGWLAYRSGAAERVGMAGNLRSPLLTTRVYPMRRGWRREYLPTVAGYLHVTQAAGASPEAATLELATTAADDRLADGVWQRLGWTTGDRVAVLNTGGAFGAAKDWPGERFAMLARRLAVVRDWKVLVNCGPKERDSAREIVAAAADRRVASLADEPELPIGLTKAIVRRGDLLVSTDSGPRFFGVAFGVPTVTLFGPTNMAMTQTYATHETSVSLGLDCQPCMKRVCPLGHHRCMRDLSIDRVLAEIDATLATTQRIAA